MVLVYGFFFFFKQKTAYEMAQCDWSSDVCSSDLTSSRSRSNMAVPTAQVIERRGSHRAGHHVGRMPALLRQPVQRALDLVRLDVHEILDRAPDQSLAGHAGGGDGRPATVCLKAQLAGPAVRDAQKEAGEIAAALVLVLTDPIRLAHEPGVPRVEEVIHDGRAVPHARPAGSATRSLRTSGSRQSTT